MLNQKAAHQRQGIGRDLGIGIKQKRIIGAGLFKADIVAAAKPGIHFLGEQADCGESGADHFRAAVGRGVVDHNDLEINAAAVPQRAQATPQQFARVVADDDHGTNRGMAAWAGG